LTPDVASVVDFDSRVEVTQGFTDDHAALERRSLHRGVRFLRLRSPFLTPSCGP
jgi:hypothetical protein